MSSLTVAESGELPMALPVCDTTVGLMRQALRFWSAADHKVWPLTFRNRVLARHVLPLHSAHVGQHQLSLAKLYTHSRIYFC